MFLQGDLARIQVGMKFICRDFLSRTWGMEKIGRRNACTDQGDSCDFGEQITLIFADPTLIQKLAMVILRAHCETLTSP